jgi:hypothetical protein
LCRLALRARVLSEDEGTLHTIRTLLFVIGLYLVHRVLLSVSPAYAERMRRLDRQLTWMSLILVVYLLANVLLRLLYSTR